MNWEVIATESAVIVMVGVEGTTAASHGRRQSSFGPDDRVSRARCITIIDEDGFARRIDRLPSVRRIGWVRRLWLARPLAYAGVSSVFTAEESILTRVRA